MMISLSRRPSFLKLCSLFADTYDIERLLVGSRAAGHGHRLCLCVIAASVTA